MPGEVIVAKDANLDADVFEAPVASVDRFVARAPVGSSRSSSRGRALAARAARG